MKRHAVVAILVAVFVGRAARAQSAAAAAAEKEKAPTIEQSLSMKSASTPKISPDGRWVVYEVSRTNWEDNAFERDLWMASAETGETIQLTRAKKSSNGAEWSPDGLWVAFTSDREGKKQIYLIPAQGGESLQLTHIEDGVSALAWSPDGRTIAFTAVDPESKAMKERKEKYGEYDVVNGDYKMTHLWTIEVPYDASAKPAEPRRLTEGDQFTVQRFAWSPDGSRIAFSGPKTPDLSDNGTSAIYVVSVADKAIKKIVDQGGPNSNPVWSPDGKRIAFQTANGSASYYYTNGRIAIVPAEGGRLTILSSAFDEDPNLLSWGPEGIYFSALQKTNAHLFRVNPATKAITRISRPDHYAASQFSFSKDFQRVAYLGAAPNECAEIYVSSMKYFSPERRLSAISEQWKDFQPAAREVIHWRSGDGTIIEGVLMKPRDFDPARKYPLLVVIHGGPTGVDRPGLSADRYYPLQDFAAKGALILMPNYRGSAGYGEKFRSLNVRNLGVGDYADVISGVDYLIGKGWVDKDRVGSMGWSEGGYISAFITTFSQRFRAVSVGAGISDWMTYYVNTDIHPFTRQYLKATPWDDPEIYKKTSPISYVKTAKTPTLIQHGGNDARVPLPNSYELYQALKDRGVPVKMVVYKGFGHPIDKPKQQRAVMEENWNWFCEWIWGEKPHANEKTADEER